MTYFDFSKKILATFSDFTRYFIVDYDGNEIDMLPYSLGSLLVNFMDRDGLSEESMDSFVKLLQEMSDSDDEEIIMLYNEIITKINSTSKLKVKLSNYLFIQKEPYPNLPPEAIKKHILDKKSLLEDMSNKYEKINKELLDQYRSQLIG